MGSAIGFGCRIVPLLLLFVSLAVGQSRSSNEDRLTLLHSSDAKGSLSLKRVNDCLDRLAHRWNLKKESLPNIVVFHVSKESARAANVNEDVLVRKNFSAKDGKGYFELWIRDEPDLPAVIVGLETILESHFSLQISPEERITLMKRVLLIEGATVSAYEGQ